MFGVYVFCAIIGIPLVLLSAFGGGDVEGEIGGFDFDADADIGTDLDFDGGDTGVGDISALRRIPITSYASLLAFFGGVGVVSTWLSVGAATTLILAVVLGVLAAVINTALFAVVRNNETDSQLLDSQLEGKIATVSVPFEQGRRGRVVIDTGGERVQLTAGSADSDPMMSFGQGQEVLIVEVASGIAKVMPLDSDLEG